MWGVHRIMMLNRFNDAIIVAFTILVVTSCAWNRVTPPKINGVSFVAPPRYIDQEEMSSMLDINANWVAIIPYAFATGNLPAITYNHVNQWWGERKEGAIRTIEYAHNQGQKVMLKPHVWVRGQGWAGDFQLQTNAQWDEWGKSYSEYILTYAKIADSLNVEMFCIGTEYRKSATLRADIWRKLIVDVRKIYNGKVIYAANWDNYQNIAFWDDLDYIGIDAYFPLSKHKFPDLKHLNAKWDSIKINIKNFSDKWEKPIIFTEFGYKSIDYVVDGHWKYDEDTLSVNTKNQVVAYRAIFDTFWKEPWFYGGFLWKWHADHRRAGGMDNEHFTPQNKPAQKTIRDYYSYY